MFVTTYYDLLERNLSDRANHVCVVDRQKEWTYAELEQRVASLAAWLAEAGVGRGDRVAIQLMKSVEEIIATFAIARLGAIFVNVYFQWTADQLRYVLNDCRTKVTLVEARRAQELVAGEWPASLERVVVKGKAPDDPRCTAWDDIPAGTVPRTRTIDVDLTAILYTSGSTGMPKGVMLSHVNLIQGAYSVGTYVKNTPDDRLMSLLPLSFDYGLNQINTMFLVGGTVVLQAVPLATEIVNTLVTQRVTGLAGIPPTWIEVVRLLLSSPVELPDLRYVTNSGGVIPEMILEGMPQVFPSVEIYLMYGLTEAFRSTFLPPELFHEKRGSMGKAIPNVEIFVVDHERGLCGPNEVGELVHRGSLISKGYWEKPEATAEKIKSCPALADLIGDEKVLFSGDLVKRDDDGYLWFVGRADGMIKCSGVRISPSEVEEVVYRYPVVREAIAFDHKDEMQGAVVHVAVSLLEGQAWDQAEFMRYCRQHMPPYMVPHAVFVWPGSMPRTSSGKLDRVTMINELRNSAANAGT